MVWTSANGPKCPVSPEDRGEFMEPTEIQSSDGGVEGHAATPSRSVHRDGMQSPDGGAVKGAGVEPGPSDQALAVSRTDPVREAIDVIERVADAIDEARYHHPMYPRERSRPFSEADKGDREYAFRLARAALSVSRPKLSSPSSDLGGADEG